MNHLKLKALLILSLTAISATALATPISNTTSIGGLAFTPSNKVQVSVISTAGTPTSVPPVIGAYTATSWHTSGSRTFGTNSVKSVIYWTDTLGTAATATLDFSSWTSM